GSRRQAVRVQIGPRRLSRDTPRGDSRERQAACQGERSEENHWCASVRKCNQKTYRRRRGWVDDGRSRLAELYDGHFGERRVIPCTCQRVPLRWGTGGVPGVPGGYFWGLFGAYSSISGT